MLQLVWFKRDLRVDDNEALYTAAQHGAVLPLYIVEPDLWRQPDAAGRQWSFIRESLLSLRKALSELGQPLVVRTGDAVQVIEQLLNTQQISGVWSHQETGNDWTFKRDLKVGDLLARRAIPWYQVRQHGVVRGSLNRDRWSRQWEQLMRVPRFAKPRLPALDDIDEGSIPGDPGVSLHDPCPGRQRGGRDLAEQALTSFLHVRGDNYHREMSSPRTADSSCSRLSAHLAAGTLSMREVVQATRKRQAALRQQPNGGSWSRALAAFEGRLHWHCHFIQKFETEPRIEFENLQRAMDGLRPTTPEEVKFQAWTRGETGWPYIDACMRYLAHNGWINFRARATLMSVASYQLWLHWRETGLHLARQFVDYEPGIHWSQVQMQSGTTGINALRIYNPIKQSQDQDPDGRFIRTWVPELSHVDSQWIHFPWRMPRDQQRKRDCLIDRDYPAPVVDHESAARLARQRMQQVRRDGAARRESRAIHQQHGSRRRAQRRTYRPPQPDLFDDAP